MLHASATTNQKTKQSLVKAGSAPARESNSQLQGQVAEPQGRIGNQAALRGLSAPARPPGLPPDHAGGPFEIAMRPSQACYALQRKCACGGVVGQGGECAACARKRQQALQRRAARQGESGIAPPIVHDVLQSPGQPLDSGARAFMEPRFGQDLGHVRIHTDSRAAESASAVNALAYTVGPHVVFGSGQYRPGADSGRQLLAHELTHTLQQRGVSWAPRVPLKINQPGDSSEVEADRFSQSITRMPHTHQSPTPVDQPGISPRPTRPVVPARGLLRPSQVSRFPRLQRVVVVNPPAAATDILGQFNFLCPGCFTLTGANIAVIPGQCQASNGKQSCECTCDTVSDPKRTYTINVDAAVAGAGQETLAGQSAPTTIPTTSVSPRTYAGNNPNIYMAASSGSSVEFGMFSPTGSPISLPNWRILGHEMCGHGRLNQGYPGGVGGNRVGHNSTIDTENAIAAEHGGDPRGHFTDPRQGESFFNPTSDRSKVVFKQVDGTHYEAP